MEIDREALINRMGGEEAVSKMDHEARADAVEDFMADKLDKEILARRAKKKYPTVAEIEEQIETRDFRRGVGKLFRATPKRLGFDDELTGVKVNRLPPMPERPTLADFFELRFNPAGHLLQSARLAKKRGDSEPVILACLLHDIGNSLIRVDHGYWGAQLTEPYVSEEATFAIRYHQALRFYADPSVNYEYPKRYYELFGEDYVPPPYIKAAYEHARNHKWYMSARKVTMNDLYAFDPSEDVSIDEFRDIIGRHFKQPKEGLGYDNTPVSHMWRSMIKPDSPL
ncbi:MAG: HD domain-containing protein [Xanthobacteraceae bacterium]|nr:HD domain-containing protein [Xanthobacteraceae bacterium]